MISDQFLKLLWEERASAILRTNNHDVAAKAMDAAVRGGFRIVEFTLTIPGALDLISDFSHRDNVIVGAGTVLTVQEAREAHLRGASFLVSPVMDEKVIREGLAMGITVMPGTHTPTEMYQAHRLGAQLQKLFPAPAGGPDYVRACLAPMPFLRIVPTNGIDLNNVADYFRAGVFAVGFVKDLFAADDLQSGRFDRIEEKARVLKAAAMAAERPK
jgi:2-dehydro-3-deoxyphosphogluconate aldolase / (4S)-4-hydroxy-2-oxoglutarate aldolase